MTTTIHYTVTEGTRDSSVDRVSPCSLELVQPDIEPWINSVDSNVIYSKCPVWNHRAKRNFIVRSPIDFSFQYHRNNPPERRIEVLKLQESVNNYIYIQDDYDYTQPVFQYRFPVILFWTNQRNVWVESKPHPYTSAHNNFVSIGGWWNITQWNRPVNFALQMVDENKPVIIRRGDPLFEVSFYNQHNLNDDIKLVRELEIPDKIWNEQHRNTNVKKYIARMNPKHLFNDKPQSKCPFHFVTKYIK